MGRMNIGGVFAAVLLTSTLLWAAGAWTPGSGFQTSLTAAEWEAQQAELRACNIDRAPYHRTLASTEYDHVVWVMTPFARAGHYARESRRLHQPTTYEEAAKRFDPSVLIVKMKTSTYNRSKSLAVRVSLRTDAGILEPYQNELTRDSLTKVGFYGRQFYIVERNFSFDLAKVAQSKQLSVILTEANDKTREIFLDVAKLR